ncbi:MAG: c-type cytochrome [Candidatus Acidiferrales bacterium]
MWKSVVVLSALLFLGFSSRSQQVQSSQGKPAAAAKVPPEALKVPNPVKPGPASIATGKKKYGYDCAMCHGTDGDGKGDLAIDMKLKMADYRDPASLKAVTDGEMFYVIKNGNAEMPSEVDRLKDEDIWNLVNYIRSIAKNSPAAAEKPKSDAP